MNEVGVDPGIDHLLAIQCFEDVQEKGGKVRRSLTHFTCVPSSFDQKHTEKCFHHLFCLSG